ncbi:MAG TPA: Rv2175c family DNA-binding protein [Flexivirga sp.]|uniref:Rv2175c family DNA-binding protein n=1 Tax=Flexivirga sp. TaxID=1962927 RepID=UPI002D168CB0|nr:Rv2175c family DNA-binding protein [Flexivirga sp.]HWC20746.1 Rv2175c family DNA-binding protein [Flexivirga sp.]
MTDATSDLETLVGEWLSIPELGDALGLTQRQARRLVDDKVVLAHRVGPNRALCVPAAFVEEDHLLTALEGTITVLRDARLSDEEALEWLFTVDPTLPVEGSPITMLLAHRKAEVRKRASELAF